MSIHVKRSIGLSGDPNLPRVRISHAQYGEITAAEDPAGLAVQYQVRRWTLTAEQRREEASIQAAIQAGIPGAKRRRQDFLTRVKQATPAFTSIDGARSLELGVIANEGALQLWTALRDGITGVELFNNTNAEIIVSNVTGSPAYTDTAPTDILQRLGMDATFPLVPGESSGTASAGDREMVFRATASASEAVGDWRRFWITNPNAAAGELILDNFSSNQGSKVNGQVWEVTVTLRFT